MKSFAGMISSSFEANIKNVQNGSVKRVRVFTENGVYVSLAVYFLICLLTTFYGEKQMDNKRFTGVRLSENDRRLLENIAKRYDITISDVVRIAIKQFIENNGIKLKEGS